MADEAVHEGAGRMKRRILGKLAFAALGAALLWSLAAIFLLDLSEWQDALLFGLGPSLALVVLASILFLLAGRR